MRRVRAALVPLLAVAVLSGCGGSEETAAERAVDEVAAGEAVLLDVRSDREFAAGHAARVQHLDHADVLDGARPRLDKDETIYVYCRSGRRAEEVVTILEREGYTDVESIGGLKDWQAAGGPVAS
ncbi:MAG: rhodanese-like domain-containing protein [Actinomycetota bacterium]|nr:rhodanese-like domain-containing protein [Actinomycetota bacterium]